MKALLVDLGRAFVRYGLMDERGRLASLDRFPTESSDGIYAALKRCIDLSRVQDREGMRLILASPGPFFGDHFVPQGMGSSWEFRASELSEKLGIGGSIVMHDMIAAALVVPAFADGDQAPIHRPGTIREGPKVVVQTGVGLGVAALIAAPDGAVITLSGEGGNTTLGASVAATEAETRMLETLRLTGADPFSLCPGTVQFALSLTSLPLFLPADERSICSPDWLSAESGLVEGSSRYEAIATYARLLATFASNLALTFNAFGGIYIAGGAASLLALPHMQFARDLVGARFVRSDTPSKEAEAPIRATLGDIPLYLVGDQYAPLRGLASYVRNLYGI